MKRITLSLRTRLSLALLLLLAAGFGLAAWLSVRQLRAAALENAVARARLLALEVVRTREYLSAELKRGGVTLSDARYGLIPVVASNRIGQQVGRDMDMTVRQTSLRFRSADNAPDAFEQAVLREFDAHPFRKEHWVILPERGVPTLRYLQPFRAEESCLVCHGDPAQAPEFLTRRFPVAQDPAYHYRIGEVIGAASIHIPLPLLERQLAVSLRQHLFILGGVFLGLVLGLGALLRLGLDGPLRRLDSALADIARTGRFDQQLPVPGSDDTLGRLFLRFNTMAAQAGENSRLLELSEQRFRAVVDRAPEAMLAALPDGKLILFNRAAQRLFGYGSAEVLGMEAQRLLPDWGQISVPSGESGLTEPVRICQTGRSHDGQPLNLELTLADVMAGDQHLLTAFVRLREG